MDKLVDIFYYDYVLCKIIGLYFKGAPNSQIAVYCKLANIFNIEYVDTKVRLDPEVYFKIILIKVIQLTFKKDTGAKSHVQNIMAYLMHLVDTHRLDGAPRYQKLVRIISICYTYHFKDDPQASASCTDFILRANGTGCHGEMLAMEGLPEDFSMETLFDHCKTFEFGRPVLFDFVHHIKKDIDQSMFEKVAKKSKVDVNGTSPGQKISWD